MNRDDDGDDDDDDDDDDDIDNDDNDDDDDVCTLNNEHVSNKETSIKPLIFLQTIHFS
jgi:hypothetical protein